MKKKTRDWQLIKQQWLQHEGMNLTQFLRDKGVIDPNLKDITDDSAAVHAVSGWKAEKLRLQQEISRNHIDAKVSKDLNQVINNLIKTKTQILSIVEKGIEDILNAQAKQPISILHISKDLKNYYQMVKTELGEPTQYNQNYNYDKTPKSVDSVDLSKLDDEDLDNLEELLNKVKKPE